MEKKLHVLFLVFLILLHIVGFIMKLQNVYDWSGLLLLFGILASYFRSNKNIFFYHVLILFLFAVSDLLPYFRSIYSIQTKLIVQISLCFLWIRFLYQNHKSFHYNRRDVFTLVLGSSLYTVIFFIAILELKEPLGELYILGLLNLALLYVLLIFAGMHYINIRSAKSLWFFLAILYFTCSDFIFLFNSFYLSSLELKVIRLFCKPIGLFFLVKYMITKHKHLKAEEFEGF